MEASVGDAGERGAAAVTPGTVYLVGAGPGAVGQLTLRALEVLCSCDVVLHDRLVPEEIVRLARPGAEVRYVGKEGNVRTEVMKVQQDGISSELVVLAKKNLSVCRLKGGDPMIFARVGEEMEELATAGVPYEIVPAVTAALAAGADARVPLTFRKLATSVRILTMNPSTTRDEHFDWQQFVAPNTTYALYMGLSALPATCERLLAAGVPAARPMAVVDRASLPAAQTVVGTVGTLPALVQDRADLPGPALVLLGDVVGLRDGLLGGGGGATAPPPTPQPVAAEAGGAAFTAARALLPAVGVEGLERLREQIDALLAAKRASAAAAAPAPPPAKRATVAVPA